MTPKPRYRRTHPDHQPPKAPKPPKTEPGGPVVVPVVEFTITDDGAMTVTVDGATYLPEPFAPGWRREAFPTILDALTARYRSPLRVQVHEADGSTFTDIITPPRERPAPRPWEVPPPDDVMAAPVRAVPPVLHQVEGAGFVPGEDVAVAIIHAHTDASSNGTARALLTAEQAALAVTGEVILLGRISGTLSIVRIQ
ncbi:MAG: hypothetical protein ACTIKK_02490 [Agrococcus casei]|uniref:Uncharacterized protein n=1 Tax=Leucobacter luti TaxID=340320 RepID=A0A4R6RTQ9_9MICO|nr:MULTISPECIES: hypothetical protein [Microbacteriaceae]MDD2818673.1 hypothetical protein [Candidatus Nanopelagicales bacterium]TDP90144.1 hypothetical protein EDF62_2709 [Leucobacter luti]